LRRYPLRRCVLKSVSVCRKPHNIVGLARFSGAGSVAALAGTRNEVLRTGVTQEVVAGKYVVDLEAVRASEPLADVALEKVVLADDGHTFLVGEQAAADVTAARLATGGGFHCRSRELW